MAAPFGGMSQIPDEGEVRDSLKANIASATVLAETAIDSRFNLSTPDIRDSKILILDGEPRVAKLLERFLRQDNFKNILCLKSVSEITSAIERFQPDLLLLDMMRPRSEGMDALEFLTADSSGDECFPVLALTSEISEEDRCRALSLGVKDFLFKPFDFTEAKLRIWNLLETRVFNRHLQEHNAQLNQAVLDTTIELEETRIEVLRRLSLAAEYRDDSTGLHTIRVGKMSGLLAAGLGLGSEFSQLITRAAPLHDIGKIGIPDAILLKPGSLTEQEFQVMRTHTTIGARILSQSQVPMLQLAEQVATSHHEHWDGSGYTGLKGFKIPIEGRIVALADAFDALTHDRPYKPAWSVSQARAEVRAQSGSHFDPALVEIFLDLDEPVRDILEELSEPAPDAAERDDLERILARRDLFRNDLIRFYALNSPRSA